MLLNNKQNKVIPVCKYCNKIYSTNGHLKRHLWETHNIGEGKIVNCIVENCDYSCKSNDNMKRHLWQVHSVGSGKIFNCEEEKCEYKCKNNGHLKRHLWQVHSVGSGKIFNCTEEKCVYTCKNTESLKQHILYIHSIGNKIIFECKEDKCEYICKTNSDLKRHIWYIHSIKNKIIYECKEENCNFSCKNNGNLKQHLWQMQIGKIFNCTEENCIYNCKTNSSFKRHLSQTHDIGDKCCEICEKNVNNVSEWICKKINKKMNICRICYNKVTGYSTRKEQQMVEFLKKDNRIGPYIVQLDKIIKGNKCKTKRRPDMVISSDVNLTIIVGCDENQHRNYESLCEIGRMDEIIDELIDSGRVVFIRWNPDYYKEKGSRGKKNREERLKMLLELIVKIIEEKKIEDDRCIEILYMFYNIDNECITNRHNKKMIYNREDF
jgi:hypothetical protein